MMATIEPTLSPHAADRWDERTAPDSVAPETAWHHAERRSDLERPCRADEVRLHRPTGTILVRDGLDIVTVMAPPFAPRIGSKIPDLQEANQ